MKQKLHIILNLIMAVIICSMFSCAPSSEEKQEGMPSMDEINSPSPLHETNASDNFDIDTLNTEQLIVFQKRAQQKLEDLINYIEIISNKSYNSEMRLIAKKQIEDLFVDSTALINISISEMQIKPMATYEFLDQVYKCDYDSIKIKTDSVIVTQPQKVNESFEYIGSISARVEITGFKNSKVSYNSTAIHKAETIIYKTEKQFGEDSRIVWTVAIKELK